MEKMKRTETCGALRKSAVGKTVILNGWVFRKRDHGGITFINLRDRYGVTQVVIDDDASDGLKAIGTELKMEYCIAVEGVVRERPESMRNADMPTGDVEVKALFIEVLSKCEVLPFQIDEKTNANEDLRLRFRYLDLRSGNMQKHIMMRSKASFAVREYLTSKDFFEIETPTFIKSTPEGARDYLVPSRLYPGKFYALPQSPQIYKQLLMVSGFDKYFQIARCYRDEDARGDRQPEFTQIDIEMSFASREDVLSLTEEMMGYMFEKTIGCKLPKQFERLSFDEAIDLYGTDKPDLRFEMKLQNADFMADIADFSVFKTAIQNGGNIKALVVKNQAENYSRKKIEELEAVAKIYKAKGLAWMKMTDGKLEGGISKFFAGCEKTIAEKLGASSGDLILFVADTNYKLVCTALGAVRSKLGKDLGLLNQSEFKFVWILDFPLFEWNEDENKWDPAHHMFSYPQEKYLPTLESDPGSVKGDLYDLVLNGYEIASGSIRIHDPELQKRIFKIVGFDEKEAEKKFGFLLNAFKYGPPPHGGIAPGLDRIIMIMAEQTSIKEVIAFPKNSFAVNPMDYSPSDVDQNQLDELHLKVVFDN
ncbi:MAG: aspartate--tRNA ligase [Treponema sp.]|nr:MAG: aspartate--tRNA ligase [Treponema sp.]